MVKKYLGNKQEKLGKTPNFIVFLYKIKSFLMQVSHKKMKETLIFYKAFLDKIYLVRFPDQYY